MMDELSDLSERIDRAIAGLGELRDQTEHGSEHYKRLSAKIEGVALVGSYVDEYLRERPSPELARAYIEAETLRAAARDWQVAWYWPLGVVSWLRRRAYKIITAAENRCGDPTCTEDHG